MPDLGLLADRVARGRLTKRDFDSRLSRYVATGSRSDGDGEALVDAFLKSGGSWLTEASERVMRDHLNPLFAQAGLQSGEFDAARERFSKDS